MVVSGPGRSGGDEPGVEAIGGCVHKWRALNTRLSSGTSAGTFAVSAGPYRNYPAKAGTKNEPDTFFVPLQKKDWKIDPHVSNLRSRFFVEGFRSTLKGGPEALENEINKILGSKRENRFSDHFSDLVQNICSVRFSYMLRLSIFCKAPRDMRKFPQMCQKIAGC